MDDAKVIDGRIEKTVPHIFSADETLDVGIDTASPVSEDYTTRFFKEHLADQGGRAVPSWS
ncbi:hypothetical protein [Nonomuraea dietziae]|uniref:hypothetical protein n=1 Tax=Nonomuraea dietziae TaxID=65515 RepID=UPI0034351CD8